ncbi:MAG: hypothetical protein AABM29_08285 [Actinomycetota bacterium]
MAASARDPASAREPAPARVAAPAREPDAAPRRPRDWRPAALREALVLGGYLTLVVIFTWPAVTKIFSEFASLDPTTTAWNFWWVKEQLFSLGNPFATDDIFAPVGTQLGFHTLSPLAGWLLAPLTAAIGAGPTTNLMKLVVPVINCYVTYRLALRLGLERWAAFAAGALYGCSPALIWRADGHFNFAAGAIFPPLALNAAVRLRFGSRTRDAVLLGVVLGASILIDLTFFLFSAGLVAAYGIAAAHLDGPQTRRPLLRGAGIAAGVAFLVALPQLVAMLSQVADGEYRQPRSVLAQSWATYGASPATLFAPAFPLEERTDIRLGLWAHRPGEGLSNYGWGLLILAVAGAVLAFRRRLVKWLIAVWLALTILSLGPSLVLGSDTYVPLAITAYGQKLSLLAPYSYLVQIPGLSDLRAAARFGLLAMLPLALLAGLGLQQLVARRLAAAWAVLALGAGLALVELGGEIRSTGPMHYDRIYGPVEDDSSESIVVDLPLTWSSSTSGAGAPYDGLAFASPEMAMLRATQHGHPAAYGVAARVGPDVVPDLLSNRFYRDLLRLQGRSVYSSPPSPNPPDPEAGGANARRLGVGWVTVWPQASRRVIPYLRGAGFERVAEEKGTLLYRIGSRR